MIEEGDKAPEIAVETAWGEMKPLGDWRGKPLVVYFYPKDDTPGCTKEAQQFTERAGEFAKLGVAVLGISKDPPAKHARFTEKYDLKVPLASDPDGSVTEAFGVWVEKNMYGRKYMGIQRATFLIDGKGMVVRVWPKVKVKGHAEEVLAAAREIA